MRTGVSTAFARRLFRDLRTEGAGRGREAAALGVGIFIGCLPFYGFHLLLVAVAGWLLGLNRLRMYLAANISNPLFAPVLVLVEIQAGAFIRRREFHQLTLEAVRTTDMWTFGGDLLIGSIVVGSAFGAAVAAATLASLARVPSLPPHLDATFAAAADRYLEFSITAWEFARAKLRRDPVYRTLLETALPPGGTLVDIGCGQGLALATLVEARRSVAQGTWDGARVPPTPAMSIGIESRKRVAVLASKALAPDARIVHAAAPEGLPSAITIALLLDVLHLLSHDEQQRLLRSIAERLEPGGVVLVREADAAGGWRFDAVRLGNRIKNVAVGNWRQSFHFRSHRDWHGLLAAQGWHVEAHPTSEGTPFANVLFICR